MSRPDPPFEILCPCCDSLLIIDRGTGAVLEHKEARPKNAIESFEAAFSALKSADASRDDRFRASVEQAKRRQAELSMQFEHLVKKAEQEDDGKPPKNPLDLD